MKDLIDSMERSARERADAILADARNEAERIRERAEREIERLRDEHRDRVERVATAEAARGLADVRREAAATELDARGEALDRVFDRARRLFAEPASRDTWREQAPRWLERALAYAPAGETTVVCDQATATALHELVPNGIRVEGRDDAAAGLVVRAGAVEIDVTLDGLLERRRERLAIEVLARLGPDREGG